jgi:predicted nucleotidyltransferase
MLLEHVAKMSLPDVTPIHLFEGGSKLHGARIEGKNDLDIYGVFIEPVTRALGMDSFEHFVSSTAGAERRNTQEDVDVTLYSLRRWAFLASKGNPTAINFLFAPNVLTDWQNAAWWNGNLKDLRKAILAKSAAGHYVGFADGQMKRLLGNGTGKHGQRSELTQEFGYDTKAAMHAVRLLQEGIELMNTGAVTLPRPEKQVLINIRQGGWSLDRVCQQVSRDIEVLETAREKSSLPAKPDRGEVNRIVSQTYLDFYTEGW